MRYGAIGHALLVKYATTSIRCYRSYCQQRINCSLQTYFGILKSPTCNSNQNKQQPFILNQCQCSLINRLFGKSVCMSDAYMGHLVSADNDFHFDRKQSATFTHRVTLQLPHSPLLNSFQCSLSMLFIAT